MEKNNTGEFQDYYQLQQQAENQEALYNQEEDNFNLINIKEEKKTNFFNKEQSRKAFVKELKEVIEESDVILQVLDARDPLNCRSKELESQILSHRDGKKIILVLNKIDLVPM